VARLQISQGKKRTGEKKTGLRFLETRKWKERGQVFIKISECSGGIPPGVARGGGTCLGLKGTEGEAVSSRRRERDRHGRTYYKKGNLQKGKKKGKK